MKRFLLPLALVLILAGAGFYLTRRGSFHTREVATWLPAGTILFEDVPDIHRTEERWPETALAQIINEPEVQAFLERPLGMAPHRARLEARLAQVQRVDPGNFFLAVTDWGASIAPRAVAGLSYSGSRQDIDVLVGELRKEVQKTWPAAKSDIENYGSGDIETFSTPNFSAALAYRGKWLFISTDTALLKDTLDRFEGKTGPDSLADLPAFKNTLQHLPSAPNNVFFLRPGLLADKAASFALMLNPAAEMNEMENLKKIEAVGVALKLEGEVMRDAAYITMPEPGDQAPLAKDALKLSTPDTIVAAGERVGALAGAQLPDPKSDPTGILQLIESYVKVFNDQGLGAQQLAEAFGPESGFVVDWPAGAVIPTPLAMVDVRDAAKARKFLDTLAALPIAAGVSFTRTEDGGITLYSLPPTGIGIFPLQVTLGLTGKGVIGALNSDGVKQAAKRWDAGGAGLDGTAVFRKAAGLVVDPTVSFTYLDTKAVFERIYGLFRGLASMGFIPHLSDYVEIGKLPAPETISRHLTPLVASTAARDGGLLVESAGPVTTVQAALVAAISAGAVAFPMIEQQTKGQSVAIPGFPGLIPGQAGPTQNPFTTPLNQGGYAIPQAPPAPPGSALPVPSASPSPRTP